MVRRAAAKTIRWRMLLFRRCLFVCRTRLLGQWLTLRVCSSIVSGHADRLETVVAKAAAQLVKQFKVLGTPPNRQYYCVHCAFLHTSFAPIVHSLLLSLPPNRQYYCVHCAFLSGVLFSGAREHCTPRGSRSVRDAGPGCAEQHRCVRRLFPGTMAVCVSCVCCALPSRALTVSWRGTDAARRCDRARAALEPQVRRHSRGCLERAALHCKANARLA